MSAYFLCLSAGRVLSHPGTKKRDPCLAAKVSIKVPAGDFRASRVPNGTVLTVRAQAALAPGSRHWTSSNDRPGNARVA